MLKIGVNAACAPENGLDGRYRMIAEAGFDGVDASICTLFAAKRIGNRQLSDVFADERTLLEAVAPYRAAAKKYGLTTYQAHAPFPTCTGDAAYDAALREIMTWCVRACDTLGCRMLVVHPVHGGPRNPLTREQEYAQTEALYASLIPAAKQYGVTVCAENLFARRKRTNIVKLMESTGSDIPEMCAMLDRLNALAGEELFGFCLDTGHLLLLGGDVAHTAAQLGSRLKTLHVHDNDGARDQHLLPYMGIQDWDRFVDGIAAADYHGMLSFEADGVWKQFDPELLPKVLYFLAETGRMFARRIEKRRTSC